MKTHQIYEKIIENVERQVASDGGEISPTTFLTYFLNERTKRSREGNSKVDFCNRNQFKHLLADIFGASVDTTLSTLRWFLLYVAKSKAIQCRIREVIFRLNSRDRNSVIFEWFT